MPWSPGPSTPGGPSSVEPERLTVVDAGAGPGGLTRTILAAAPRCGPSLSFVLVDVGEGQWAAHPDGTTSRADMPAPGELGDGPVVVLANELLDNLPVALAQWTSDGWQEVAVGVDGDAAHRGPAAVDRGAGGVVRGPGGRCRPGRPDPGPGRCGRLAAGCARPGRRRPGGSW